MDNPLEICDVCKVAYSASELVPGHAVRDTLATLIRLEHPEWGADSSICRNCLDRFRKDYVTDLLTQDARELSSLEKQVIESLARQEIVSRDLDSEFDAKTTFGQRIADKVATFGGSWTFIGAFFAALLTWIAFNSWGKDHFDPYPFILLNLVLSCLAAIQAPVIMMSQNRQEEKDRARSIHDYKVNLKAELKIQQLHEKLDHLVSVQMRRLMEVQELQMEMLATHTREHHANQENL